MRWEVVCGEDLLTTSYDSKALNWIRGAQVGKFGEHFRGSTNQHAIPNRRTSAKEKEILLMWCTTIWRTTAPLVDGDGDGGGDLAEGVGRVESVGGVGRGRDGDGRAADGADCGRNDDVGGAGNLPGKRDRRAGRDGSGAGSELRDGGRVACGNVGAGVERGHLDDFEIGGVDIAEIVEVGIVPTIIGSAAEVHGRAVVSKDETVFFESVENDLIGGGEARNVERRFETQTHAHWRSVLIGRIGSPVRGGRNKSR